MPISFSFLFLVLSLLRRLLLMLPGRAVDTARAVGGGTAPDALIGAGTVAVLARWGVDASRAVARRTAPFAMLLVIAMFVFARR